MQLNKMSRGLLFALMLAPAFASAQVITTVEGSAANNFGHTDVVADTNGNFYIASAQSYKIKKVSADGTITTIAGTGERGYSGDNGPAINAKLSEVTSITIDRDGNLYFADEGMNRIRKITTDGIIHTVAGNGLRGFGGDGGPATSARVSVPTSVAVDHVGNVYIVSPEYARVRKVDTNGIITTVAGTGVSGFSGDGGPATAAQIGEGGPISVNAQGELFIAGSRIRKVDLAGNISTVAGNGAVEFSGDGGNALSAGLYVTADIDVDASGNVFITQAGIERVRKIDTSGVINTVAGSGASNYSGDGGPATLAGFRNLLGIDADHLGNLYLAEYNGRIRKVSAPAPDATGPEIVPIVEGPQGQNGWYNGQVSVGWDVYDQQSLITSRSGCDITTLANDTSDVTLTCTATSAGGTSTVSKTIRIDSTAPTLNPTIVPSPVIVNENATALANATDALSGVASQSCTPVDTASVGAKSVTCVAQDVAGNQRSATKAYSVFYGFNSFLSPLVEAPSTNRIKKGRTLPVRFSLVDGQGNPILNLVSAQAQFVAAAACDGTFQGVVRYPPNTYVVGQGHDDPSALQNLGGGIYQLNWLVPTAPRDVCGQLRVGFDDGMNYALNLWIE